MNWGILYFRELCAVNAPETGKKQHVVATSKSSKKSHKKGHSSHASAPILAPREGDITTDTTSKKDQGSRRHSTLVTPPPLTCEDATHTHTHTKLPT